MEIEFCGVVYHTLYLEAVPPMSTEDRWRLEQSIREFGVECPILLDDKRGIIDGVNRLLIAASLGLPADKVRFTVCPGLKAEDKKRLRVSMNKCRRQLTTEDIAQMYARAKGGTR